MLKSDFNLNLYIFAHYHLMMLMNVNNMKVLNQKRKCSNSLFISTTAGCNNNKILISRFANKTSKAAQANNCVSLLVRKTINKFIC